MDWWQPYTEEWLVPPVERAKRVSEKQAFYVRLSSPLVKIVLLRGACPGLPPRTLADTFTRAVLLTPLSFIPGLALVVLSAIRSLTMGRLLHRSVRFLLLYGSARC